MLLALLPVMFAGVSACGDDTGTSATGSLDGVTVTGKFGEQPTIAVDGLDAKAEQNEVLIEGDGNPAKLDGKAMIHVYIADGTTGEKAISTWDQEVPTEVTLDAEQLFKQLVDALEGVKVGSRIALVAPVTEIWGAEGNSQIGLDPGEAAIFVVDLIAVEPTDVLDGPEGEDKDVAGDLPAPVVEDGDVTGIDFSAAPAKPSDELQIITLIEGDGPKVVKGSFVAFDYFGEVYGGTEPFDESFSGDPITFSVGTGNLIRAWDEGLIGIPEGSRVLIISPAEYGYGEGGTQGIPGGATLVFVVDVLGVG
jgi:peptidylprolyl isomerase